MMTFQRGASPARCTIPRPPVTSAPNMARVRAATARRDTLSGSPAPTRPAPLSFVLDDPLSSPSSPQPSIAASPRQSSSTSPSPSSASSPAASTAATSPLQAVVQKSLPPVRPPRPHSRGSSPGAPMQTLASARMPKTCPRASHCSSRLIHHSGEDVAEPIVPTLPLRADVLLSHTLFEEFDDQGISVELLQRYLGTEHIEETEFLEIQVDANASQRVEGMGELLPQLRQLRLSQSYVFSIRDLGTGLRNLRVLWLCRASLQDLSGLAALPMLEELYAPFNDVRDLTPLCAHEVLQVLDLEGNLVDDFGEVATLDSIPSLRELTLTGNPISKARDVTRKSILDALPQLEVLDEIPRDSCEDSFTQLREIDISAPSDECIFEDGTARIPVSPADESPALNEFRQRVAALHGGRGGASTEPDEHELVLENVKRAPRHMPNLWGPQRRPGAFALGASIQDEGFRPSSRCSGVKPRRAWGSAASSASTSYRPGTASSEAASSYRTSSVVFSTQSASEPEASSELTAGDGGALVGTPLAAVRRRRKNAGQNGEDDHSIRSLLARYKASASDDGVCSASDVSKEEGAIADVRLFSKVAAPENTPEECTEIHLRRPCTPDVRIGPSRIVTGRAHGTSGSLGNAWGADALDLECF